jgi:methylmalonyl-CoA mutase
MSEEIPTEKFELEPKLNLKSEFTPPTFEEWKEQVEKDLKGASYEKKLITKTYEGINLNPIYSKKDITNSPFIDSLPSGDNFVRGSSSSGYHGKSWDVNQEILTADVEDFNNIVLDALCKGQNCINLKLDTATKLGLDADYADTEMVGDTGLSISAINSLKRALKNIDFDSVPLYIDAGYNVIPFLSLINAYFEESNLDISKLSGSIIADPIAQLTNYNELPVDLEFVFDMMKNSVEWGNKFAGNIKTIGINTIPYLNAGANAVQELAYAMSTLVYYLNELIERGLEPENVFSKIQFSFGVSTNYFMEIAKFRAVNVLLKAIASEFGIDNKDLKLNIGAKSSEFNQTVLDPYVNMLRTTSQTFSAILGGVNYITTSPFDETLRRPDNFSRRIARNTQTILREESHLDQVIDPAGGSYYIESLTEEIAKKSWELFKEVESNGGILESLKTGFIQKSINEIFEQRQNDINKRKSVIVGTNMFADVHEKELEIRKFDQKAFQKKRSEYLKKFRVNGSTEKHQAILDKLNLIPNSNSIEIIETITEAFRIGSTIGEVTSSLYSSHKVELKINKLVKQRASEGFEKLRHLAQNYRDKNGHLPKVFLANYGSISEYKARADFSKGFFEVGGFDVIDPKGFKTTEEVVNASLESGATVIVICSTDDNYPEIVPKVVSGLKSQHKNLQIILAGYPNDQVDEHKKSGIDDFIFLGANVMEKLTNLFNKIGGTK